MSTKRDVFSGKQSLSLGDESGWILVDEDDDVPAFAGGRVVWVKWSTTITVWGLAQSRWHSRLTRNLM